MKRLSCLVIILLSFIFLPFALKGESSLVIEEEISWFTESIPPADEYSDILEIHTFEDASLGYDGLPFFQKRYSVPEGVDVSDVKIIPVLHGEATDVHINASPKTIENSLTWKQLNLPGSDKKIIEIGFSPFLLTDENTYRKVIAFETTLELSESKDHFTEDHKTTASKKGARETTESVLKNGNWYKIGVKGTGIYTMDKAFLEDLGLNLSGKSLSDVRIYGHGGSMLPEQTDLPRTEDLKEIPSITKNNKVLFYAEGPVQWNYNNQTSMFIQEKHLYSNTIYYFVTADKGKQNSPEQATTPSGTPEHTVTSYTSRDFHEENLLNDMKVSLRSGRDWLGEEFDRETSKSFSFNLPDLITSEAVKIHTKVGARSRVPSTFSYRYSGSSLFNISINEISGHHLDFYFRYGDTFTAFNAKSSSITIDVDYNKPQHISIGWMGSITLNGRSSLRFRDDILMFRDVQSYQGFDHVKFEISNAPGDLIVWDITDIHEVRSADVSISGSTASFEADVNELREYVAFTPSITKAPQKVGRISNQNLHGSIGTDYVMVVHPDFREAAEKLKAFHESYNGFKVQIVEPQEIYNEFSSGVQDPSAIRDFARMIYARGISSDESRQLRYLLLFGDGSFDPKDRVTDNSNFIVTYQSYNTNHPGSTYVTDDFFGFLDDNEGSNITSGNTLNIAIGRLPARTSTEAHIMVDKIIRYHKDENRFGNWRNKITMIGDDGDGAKHMIDSESLADVIDRLYPVFNLNKIYSDAYELIGTPSGPRYPGVNRDFERAVNEGSLLINYMGHGGPIGLAEEEILRHDDIHNWENEDRLTLFVTGTCELTRFDDPGRRSGGEIMLLKPDGGAIALLSTTRLVYATNNFNLMKHLYTNNLLEPVKGRDLSIGEAFKNAKNSKGFDENTLKFLVLGDPAIKLAIPEQVVKTTKVNNNPVEEKADSIGALDLVKIDGEVTDHTGNRLSDFNGKLNVTVYDKPMQMETLNNRPESPVMSYKSYNSTIFRGTASVENGKFSFQFVVPKDINYTPDSGRISYYAFSAHTDATGYDKRIIIGGTTDSLIENIKRPKVNLYMDDLSFRAGDYVGENPVLIARVSDDLGINMTGAGVGHSLTATHNNENTIILNDYYETDLDSYQNGEIRYPMFSLKEGRHDISVKVWNVANLSNTASTHFIVATSEEIVLQHIFNYPNPFHDYTNFNIQHNRAGDDLRVAVELFDLNGRRLRQLTEDIPEAQTNIRSIKWDGTDSNGSKLQSGVYLYKITLSDGSGRISSETGRLILK